MENACGPDTVPELSDERDCRQREIEGRWQIITARDDDIRGVPFELHGVRLLHLARHLVELVREHRHELRVSLRAVHLRVRQSADDASRPEYLLQQRFTR